MALLVLARDRIGALRNGLQEHYTWHGVPCSSVSVSDLLWREYWEPLIPCFICFHSSVARLATRVFGSSLGSFLITSDLSNVCGKWTFVASRHHVSVESGLCACIWIPTWHLILNAEHCGDVPRLFVITLYCKLWKSFQYTIAGRVVAVVATTIARAGLS